MATDKVGIKAGMTIKKETVDEVGKVVKREFFFPSLNQSAEAETMEEARGIAEAKKVKAKK